MFNANQNNRGSDMLRIILTLTILFIGMSIMAEEWTASTVSVPVQYGGMYPNYYASQQTYTPNNSTYYNPLGVNQGSYQYYNNYPYQSNYGNYGYNPYYTYPNTLSSIGGNGPTGQILRNIGRNVLYSFMRGY